MESGKDTIDIIQTEIDVLQIQVAFARKRDEKIGALDRSAARLLGELYEKGPLGISALADIFQLDISTVSRQIAALEAKGYAIRIPDPKDGRVSLLEITPSGKKQFIEVRQARRNLYNELLVDWSEEERKKFGEYLQKLNRAIIERRLRLKAET